jgi:hypothetical protein
VIHKRFHFSSLVLVLVGLLFCSNSVLSQHELGKKRLLKLAEQHYERSEFSKAIELYRQIIAIDIRNTDAAYGLARSYHVMQEHELAHKWYLEIAQKNEEDFPEIRYHLGCVTKMMGRYQSSLEHFTMFLKNRPEASRQVFEAANHERNGVLLAIDQSNKGRVDFDFRPLPSTINTTASEQVMYNNSNAGLVVLSLGPDAQHGITPYQKEGGSWFRQLNSWPMPDSYGAMELFLGQMSGDGAIFYLAVRHGDKDTWRLAVVDIENGHYGCPQVLSERVNSRLFNNTDPTTTVFGDTLIFSSDRPGGYGGYDLWYAVMKQNSEWRKPVNLGPVINTARDERFPFYYHKDGILFFSSNGHIGYGQMDVYYTVTPFSSFDIVNIGAPFNSGYNDQGLILGPEHGFLSSDRKGGEGGLDVYIFNKVAEDPRIPVVNIKAIESVKINNMRE